MAENKGQLAELRQKRLREWRRERICQIPLVRVGVVMWAPTTGQVKQLHPLF
jgi:hypothetical protein